MAQRFNPAPGWPQPPEGWTPPPGWRPDPSWPPAPEGWQFWIDDAAASAPPAGEAAAPSSAAPSAASADAAAERPGPADATGQSSVPAPQHLGPSAAAAAAAGPASAAGAPGPEFGEGRQDQPAQQVGQDQPAQQFGQDQPTQQFGQDQPTQQFGQDQPTQQFAPPSSTPQFGQDQTTQQFGQQPFGDAPTHHFGSAPYPPTQQFGAADPHGQPPAGGYGGAGAGFDYAAAQQEQGTSPYSGQPTQQYPDYAAHPGQPGGPEEPRKKRTGLIVTIVVVLLLILGGLIWGIIALLSGDSDADPDAGPTQAQTQPADDPTTDDPTPEPTTEAPTSDPTDADSAGPDAGGDVVSLAPGEFATINSRGTEIAEFTITELERDWTPDPNNTLCGEPDDGTEYVLLHAEVNTNGDVDPGGFFFTGMEISTLDDNGDEAGKNMAIRGITCLDDTESLPSEWQANESYSGLILAAFTSETSIIQYEDFLDFSADAATYQWRVADFE